MSRKTKVLLFQFHLSQFLILAVAFCCDIISTPYFRSKVFFLSIWLCLVPFFRHDKYVYNQLRCVHINKMSKIPLTNPKVIQIVQAKLGHYFVHQPSLSFFRFFLALSIPFGLRLTNYIPYFSIISNHFSLFQQKKTLEDLNHWRGFYRLSVSSETSLADFGPYL